MDNGNPVRRRLHMAGSLGKKGSIINSSLRFSAETLLDEFELIFETIVDWRQ